MDAVEHCDPRTVTSLLPQIKNPTIRTKEGQLVFFAIDTNSCIQAFVEAGINVNIRNAYDKTMLHNLACSFRTGPARYLLEHNADVNAQTPEGATPVHFAAACGELEMLQLFAEFGADFTAKDKNGKTPLDYAKHKQKTNPFFNKLPIRKDVVQFVSQQIIQQKKKETGKAKDVPLVQKFMGIFKSAQH